MPLDPSAEDFKYWAFISYSHSDDKWAEWLHKSLETYKVPKNIVGKPTREGIVPARAYPIFRDRDELPGSANLGENIESALRLSRYLIVICSPRAVQSKWVDKEVRMFKSWGREDRVLCLVTDGEPNATGRQIKDQPECMPPAVRFWVDRDGNLTEIPTEPIAADARKGKDGKNNALLKLLAGILGVNYNDLKNREAMRREKQVKVVSAGVLALMIIFGILSVALYFQKNEAVNSQRQAESEREVADRARDVAEQARKAEEVERHKAEAARNEAIASAEAEREAKLKATESEKQAKASEKIAKDAEKTAKDAEKIAVDARNIAIRKQAELQQTLSRSDLASAAKLIEEKSEGKALAYLARSLRYDAENPAVVARAISLLSQRNWPLPVFEPLKHPGEVRSAVFSPGGKQLITISENAAYVWESATGQPIFEPLTHKRKINAVEFSPDGRWIVTVSEDATAQVWDAMTGKRVGETMRHQDVVLGVTFSKNGKLIGTVSQDRTARVWNLSTGQAVTPALPHESPVQAIALHPDGKTAVTTSASLAKIWDLTTGQMQGVEMKHEGTVYCAEYSPDGRVVATGSSRAVRLWDAVTGLPVSEPMKHENWVSSVVFSPDGKQLLTASSDTTARLWDVATGQVINQPLKHDAGVKTAYFSPNARWIVTASADGTARVWDAATCEPVCEPMRHFQPVHEARFSPDGKSVVTASADRTAKVWTILNGKPVVQILRHGYPVNGGVFAPDGKRFVTVASDRAAHVWDTISGKRVTEPLRHKRAVISAAISPDGKYLATADENFVAVLWDIDSGKLLHANEFKHDGAVTDVQFSPDGRLLVTASDDNYVRMWDVAKGTSVLQPLRHERPVKVALFSPDGKWIISASSDNRARVWSVADGKLVSSFEHKDEVFSVDISPDGQWIISGSEDRTVFVWKASDGALITKDPIQHDGPVNFVEFSPAAVWNEKKWFLTASERVARIWEIQGGFAKAVTEPIKVDEPIRDACFSPDGQFIALGYGKTVRIWDSSGKPAIDAFSHEGPVRSVTFSPRERFLLTTSDDQTARLSLFTLPGAAPSWLPDLVSAIGGYNLDNFGAAEMISDSWTRIGTTALSFASASSADDYATWAKWFTANRSSRTVTAFSTVLVSDYLSRRVSENTAQALEDVLNLQPDNALALAKISRLTKDNNKADFLSALAQRYEPENSDVLWHRAQVLQQLNRFTEAWEIMERAIKLDPRNIVAFGPDGTEVTCANLDGTASKGWLPKGWLDANDNTAVNVTYSNIAKSDIPKEGASVLGIVAEGEGRNIAEVRGPHFICKRNQRCTIEGWVRSSNRSDVTVIAAQFVEPNQRLKEQVIHATPEWKQFKVQFAPVLDIAAEVRLQLLVGSNVEIGAISVKAE